MIIEKHTFNLGFDMLQNKGERLNLWETVEINTF